MFCSSFDYYNDLLKYKEQGLVTLSSHPTLDLYIAKYTPKVQYESLWDNDPFLLFCRSLVVNNDGRVISPGLPKFFNIEEVKSFPKSMKVKIYEKLDGSLISAFWYNDNLIVSSCGSFTSPQAIWARNLIYSNYQGSLDLLKKYKNYKDNISFFFELIHPENRIIVDYGNSTRLVLLAIRGLDKEHSIEDIDYTDKPKMYDLSSMSVFEIREKFPYDGNSEGYVISWDTGQRVKVKYPEYVYKHKVLSGLSTKTILNLLKEEKSIADYIKILPDESYDFFHKEYTKLLKAYDRVLYKSVEFYYNNCLLLPTRKALAEVALTFEYPNVIFNIEDGKPPSKAIWKIVEDSIDVLYFCKGVSN